jgi:hypothetical protein
MGFFKKLGKSIKKTTQSVGKSITKAAKSVGKSIGKGIGNVFKGKPVNGVCITRECRLDRDLKKLKKRYSELKKRADDLLGSNSRLINVNTNLSNNNNNLSYDIVKQQYNKDGQISVLDMNNEQSNITNNILLASVISAKLPDPNYNSYQDIVSENTLLINKVNSLRDTYQLGDQKSYYEGKQNNYLSKLNSALFWFYYILLILFTYVLFFIDNVTSNYLKIVILILSLSYPFIVMRIENFLYKIYKITVAFMNVNPYTNNY